MSMRIQPIQQLRSLPRRVACYPGMKIKIYEGVNICRGISYPDIANVILRYSQLPQVIL